MGPRRSIAYWSHLRDYDSKFVPKFDAILKAEGVKVVPVGPRAPNLNAYAERFVQTIKSECLDHFVVFGEEHLRFLCSEFLRHYHEARPHQGVGNRPLTGIGASEWTGGIEAGTVMCQERLGGLLKHYARRAA